MCLVPYTTRVGAGRTSPGPQAQAGRSGSAVVQEAEARELTRGSLAIPAETIMRSGGSKVCASVGLTAFVYVLAPREHARRTLTTTMS